MCLESCEDGSGRECHIWELVLSTAPYILMSETASNKEIAEAKEILSHSSLSYSYLNKWGIENDMLCIQSIKMIFKNTFHLYGK